MNLIKRIFGINSNALITLFPFKCKGVWLFNDKAVGLQNEAFILGIDDMINRLTRFVPNAENGFRLTISSNPFPNYMIVLERREKASRGRWYYCPHYKMDGWLCPALFRYFWTSPKRIYARADEIPRKV